MSILQKRSALYCRNVKRAFAKPNPIKFTILNKMRPDKGVEMEFPTFRLFCSYQVPVAMHDKTTNEYFRTDMINHIVDRDIDKWLDGIEATPKPQKFFNDFLDPERYPK